MLIFFIPALFSGPPKGQVEEMPDVQSKQNQLKQKHMQWKLLNSDD